MDQFDIIRKIAEIKLKEKNQLTDLEEDVLDTLSKIQAHPFDRNEAILQIVKNNGKYSKAFVAELAKPQNKLVDVRMLDNPGLLSNLQTQLEYMVIKHIAEAGS